METNISASEPKKHRAHKTTSAHRRAVARKAANARWGDKKAAEKAVHIPRPYRKRKQKATRTHEAFGDALVAAENRLAVALEERADLANTTGGLDAEIAWLIQTISVLKNPQNAQASNAYGVPAFNPQPFQTKGPQVTRALGAAMGVNLADEEAEEDRFLKASAVAEGAWH